MAIKFAKRLEKAEGSAIREILKLASNPEVISFAGGLPAPELFPVEEMKKVAVAVMEEQGRAAMQYSATDGYPPLREAIAERMNRKLYTNVTADSILVTNGSQQCLDFMGRVFLDEGDKVIVESPSYLGALNAFKAYGPQFIEIPTDGDGMIMSELEKALEENPDVKFIYVIPDFQNPSGRTWPIERREKFMEIINKYEIPVAEDNPYGELRFEGEIFPSLKSYDTKGLVCFFGTFSKILCPGYRLGWVSASPKILEKFNISKQASDLQASTISQMEIAKYIEMFDLDAHVEKIKEVYGHRRTVMLDAMDKYFPEGVTFTRTDGGLFTWVTLPEGIDAAQLMKDVVLPNNVAYVPGEPFYPNGGNANHFRMNYSCMPEDKIVEGVKRLGKALTEAIEKL
ncbi:PLP-dependent aminotransferase family protein [Peptostreptococcus canis]|uniref:PLP-dependent aminotransferase family protein n=1 Tax=Peptostreptococcus canis TaxID=1159213 RepID=A0ABR6TMM4_9FIRM|nr:PLP-dependent aminotransferase family protein [Peptostreptococcus canis]MBC2576675.1 PLP-dependent aminotransferase family protein [Peptostreptococcus canis]MBP1998575.1 2-aminoadipate transaminase [Peptostreptococcus canis]